MFAENKIEKVVITKNHLLESLIFTPNDNSSSGSP